MTITAHPDDETVRVVTEESEIVPALRMQNPVTRAVFYHRPELTKLFTAAGAIVARRDEDVLFSMGDYFRNSFAERYSDFRKLDLNGSWRQVFDKAVACAIDLQLETAQSIFDDIKYVHGLSRRVSEEYNAEVPSQGCLNFNIVAKGTDGCAPKIHLDTVMLNTHVSYSAPLQWLAKVPSDKELKHIFPKEELETSGVPIKHRIKETQIGDVVFFKGLGLHSVERKMHQAHSDLECFPHRSSDKIKECGQIAVAIF